MMSGIAILPGILIPALWIFLPLRKVPADRRLGTGVYIRSILVGMTLTTVCIMLAELLWDRVTGIRPAEVTNRAEAVLCSFLRAALLEEGIKWFFVKRVLKKRKPADKLQYMLLAGTIGMGYGITEKLVLGPLAALTDAFFALHIMFQFVMGACLYEAGQSREQRERKRAEGLAFLLPLCLHGLWDSILSVCTLGLEKEMTAAGVISLLLMLAAVIGALVGEIRMILYLRKLQTDPRQQAS